MVHATVLIFCSLIICCCSLKDFDFSPVGFSVTNSTIKAFFPSGTFRFTFDRATYCDGEVNGIRLEKMTYVTSFSTDYYDGCTISFPLSARPIKTVKVIVDHFFGALEMKNETLWEFLFDMANISMPKKILFGKTNLYSIQRMNTLKNGNLRMRGVFKMKYKGARPLYSSFKFDGVDLNDALSAEDVNVRINANGETQTDEKVSMEDKIKGKYISSRLTIDASLVKSIGGTRGLMYFGATFEVAPYLKITGSINIGFEIYTLSDGLFLFPYGSVAMLEPAKNNSVVTLKRHQYSLIPCLIIGTSQMIPYPPTLKKLNPDGSSSQQISKMNRMFIGLYYREFSPVVSGNLSGIEGTYQCEFTYDVKTNGRREERSIRRVFNVTIAN